MSCVARVWSRDALKSCLTTHRACDATQAAPASTSGRNKKYAQKTKPACFSVLPSSQPPWLQSIQAKSFAEIARLRAEISANPAPDEKCSLPNLSTIHFIFLKFTGICRRRLLGPSCLGTLRRQKCSSKLRQGSHPRSKELIPAQRTRPVDDGVFD